MVCYTKPFPGLTPWKNILLSSISYLDQQTTGKHLRRTREVLETIFLNYRTMYLFCRFFFTSSVNLIQCWSNSKLLWSLILECKLGFVTCHCMRIFYFSLQKLANVYLNDILHLDSNVYFTQIQWCFTFCIFFNVRHWKFR